MIDAQLRDEFGRARNALRQLAAYAAEDAGFPQLGTSDAAGWVARVRADIASYQRTRAQLDAMLDRTRDEAERAKKRLAELQDAPRPLPGSRAEQGVRAEVSHLEQSLVRVAEDERELRMHQDQADLDLAGAALAGARVVLPGILHQAASHARSLAAEAVRNTGLAAMAVVRPLTAYEHAVKLAEQLTGEPVDGPCVVLPHRDSWENVTRREEPRVE